MVAPHYDKKRLVEQVAEVLTSGDAIRRIDFRIEAGTGRRFTLTPRATGELPRRYVPARSR